MESSNSLDEGFFLGQKGGDIYAEVVYKPTSGNCLIAKSYIEAPGKGDELVKQLDKKLQEEANKRGKKIIYQPQPENKGSRLLHARSPGYKKLDIKDQFGNPIYEKVFTPQ